MRNIFLVVLLFVFATTFAYGKTYTIELMIGDVVVKNGKNKINVDIGYVIKKGDVITTGKDSECYISVDNGKGTIKIEEKSSIAFEEIDKVTSNGTIDKVNLKGNIVSSVEGVYSENAMLGVKTRTAFATVRGTEFVMEVGKDDTTTSLYVLEGKVAIVPLVALSEEELISRSIFVNEGQKIEISEIDVINATSFITDEEKFEGFMTKKKVSLIASERERFKKRINMLKEIQQKRKEELEKKKKEYLKDPSKLFEDD
ncbi:MAG: FecR domain-containing protein [Brevinematia bacterium]